MRTVKKSEHNAYQIHYHFVCPVKYRKALFGFFDRENTLRFICREIEERYEYEFEQIGIDTNHVHFFMSAAPKFSPSIIIQTMKSIIAREMFKKHPDLKKELLGGAFWTEGFFGATVGESENKDVIREYVRKQGFQTNQLKLFDF
ncbi:MAG: Transposase IS200-like protein [Candidatus Uhrbacteria bacterium GW2011_GWF2_41_16]|uniref:Transposase IS200-like protein n=2 Tax=Candidatus Uhriibacteriota TaxID=1752732 RepID=A0A0G0VFH2_9BACT|nr:MAG: Transposase IS200-like protein [Candidatus Uhrbacteria bacterium GW2011_GWA2_41_10]KKR87436.1 MAG: Transposase IS200-like protein [Candidatus Uhrbacteria bacterium GW2011_GWC2_41_11]KKR98391.1 MAG: Transposase IS200-like protein [Candidatus Uhrbacteria bacterium GW2011_GWF2_41_16]HBP00505.1 IS200/IS605 family transposase [Candidatus Uhrbacteria bacterium]